MALAKERRWRLKRDRERSSPRYSMRIMRKEHPSTSSSLPIWSLVGPSRQLSFIAFRTSISFNEQPEKSHKGQRDASRSSCIRPGPLPCPSHLSPDSLQPIGMHPSSPLQSTHAPSPHSIHLPTPPTTHPHAPIRASHTPYHDSLITTSPAHHSQSSAPHLAPKHLKAGQSGDPNNLKKCAHMSCGPFGSGNRRHRSPHGLNSKSTDGTGRPERPSAGPLIIKNAAP
ncbi:hypothetical protein HDK64DRAFT_46569 [Phyllosticta capitalensis]